MTSIDIPFGPGKHIDEWGFVWEGEDAIDDGAWRLCQVFLDDCDQLFVRVWDEYSPDEPVVATEEAMAGKPYLPMIWPKADPGAGLEVTMRLNGGASATHTIIEPGAKAERIKEAVSDALFPRPERQTRDLEALRLSLANAPEDDCGNDKLCADACNAIGELRLSLRLMARRLDKLLAEGDAKKEPSND